MARTFEFYVDRALAANEEGFASKAAQQRALADVNAAFDICKRELADALLADRSLENWNELYYGVPSYPHLWRPAHAEAYSFLPETAGRMSDLAALRDAIKAAPIAPVAKREPNALEVKSRETILELMARRGAQHARGLKLGELFGGLPVHANVHIVRGHKGAVFLRAFYYLAGEFTPLNVIIAAAEELERRKEGAA